MPVGAVYAIGKVLSELHRNTIKQSAVVVVIDDATTLVLEAAQFTLYALTGLVVFTPEKLCMDTLARCWLSNPHV
jgi:cell shape-determining protein MreD